MRIHQTLTNIYTDPANPAGYGTINQLYLAAKKKHPKIKLHQVKTWLQSQNTYTLHRQARRKFPQRKTLAKGIRYQFQLDLVDMQSLKKWNSQKRYLLTAIDIFSRRAAVEPISNKSGGEVVRGLQKILKKLGKPLFSQTDLGKEFHNSEVKKYFNSKNIHHFSTASDVKCSLVERFHSTLQNRLYKYFTQKSTFAYLPVLQKIVTAYNNRYHRSIGRAPSQVTKKNEQEVWNYQYGSYFKKNPPKFKYKIHQTVRISKSSRTFRKGYMPQFQPEYFTIADRLTTTPPVYKLMDKNKEILKGIFYESELQLARPASK
jgi:hypothetical protein